MTTRTAVNRSPPDILNGQVRVDGEPAVLTGLRDERPTIDADPLAHTDQALTGPAAVLARGARPVVTHLEIN